MNKLDIVQDIIDKGLERYVLYHRRVIKKGDEIAKEALEIYKKNVLHKLGLITTGSGWVIKWRGGIYDPVNFYDNQITKFTRKDFVKSLADKLNLREYDIVWER